MAKNALGILGDSRTPEQIHEQVGRYLQDNAQFLRELEVSGDLSPERLSDEYVAAVAEGMDINRNAIAPESWDAFLDALSFYTPVGGAQDQLTTAPIAQQITPPAERTVSTQTGQPELGKALYVATVTPEKREKARRGRAAYPGFPTDQPPPDMVSQREMGQGDGAIIDIEKVKRDYAKYVETAPQHERVVATNEIATIPSRIQPVRASVTPVPPEKLEKARLARLDYPQLATAAPVVTEGVQKVNQQVISDRQLGDGRSATVPIAEKFAWVPEQLKQSGPLVEGAPTLRQQLDPRTGMPIGEPFTTRRKRGV